MNGHAGEHGKMKKSKRLDDATMVANASMMQELHLSLGAALIHGDDDRVSEVLNDVAAVAIEWQRQLGTSYGAIENPEVGDFVRYVSEVPTHTIIQVSEEGTCIKVQSRSRSGAITTENKSGAIRSFRLRSDGHYGGLGDIEPLGRVEVLR